MAAIAVTAPDPGFTGTRAGVDFRDGRAEVEAENASALAYFTRQGYTLGEPSTPTKRGRAPAREAEAPIDADPA